MPFVLTILLSCVTLRAEVSFHETRLWQRAKTASPGQKAWSFKSSFAQVNQQFGAKGELQPLKTSQATSRRLQQVNRDVQIERQDLGLQAEWSYGLLEPWTIGFQLPLSYTTTRLDQIRRTGWEWGDISLIQQLRLSEDRHWSWAVQQQTRLPTSLGSRVEDVPWLGRNDGQLDLGLTSMWDWRLPRSTLGLRVGYVVQTPDRVRWPGELAGPRSVDLNRNLGDYVWLSMDVDWRVDADVTVNVELNYLDRQADSFSEPLPADLVSGQQLTQGRLSFIYRLRQMPDRLGVQSKWLAIVGMTQTLAARNSADVQRASAELITYF